MRSRYLGVALAIGVFLLAVTPVAAQSGVPIGTVISARSGQVGSAPAQVGSTVFSGDRLVTQKDSGLIIQAGKFQFSFQDGTVATIAQQPGGLAVEIESGSFTMSSLSPDPGLTVFVSDLRIAPKMAQAFSADVSVSGECAVVVTSRVGQLVIQRAADRVEVPERTSVQLTPRYPIEQRPPGVPMGDTAFHRPHSHPLCKVPTMIGSKGPNWFVPVLLVEAAVVPIVVWRQSVSPN